jgi:hypothetical protein
MDQFIEEALRSEFDAIELLMQDQREVECLFREFEYLHKRREETCRVVRIVCAELKMHDILSTEVFFPALLEAAGELEIENLLAAAEDGQRAIRDLIMRVEEAGADHDRRDAHFSTLARHVGRHFHEAEMQLFPRAKKLERLDLVSIASKMKARRSGMLAQAQEE